MEYFAITNYTSNATGIRLDKCFIAQQVYDQTMSASITSVVVNIENCIFSTINTSGLSGLGLGQKTRGLLRNNTFNAVSSINCFNFYIANNIVVGNTDFGTVLNSGNNVYRNNILSYPANTQNLFVTNNGGTNLNNLFGQNMDLIFTGATDNVYNGTSIYNNRIVITGNNVESRFELETSANAATAGGESGTTFGAATVTTPACGATGATDPYRKGGFPAIPRIYSLTVPATVPNGAPTMTIAVSSSSNN